MPTLNLRIDIEGLPTDGEPMYIIANIYPTEKENADQAKRNIKIPCSSGVSWDFESIELKFGQYLIEAVLPSGKIIGGSVNLNEERKSVILQAKLNKDQKMKWMDLFKTRHSSGIKLSRKKISLSVHWSI